ncbi:MAG: tryptophan-rich sensory protein [Bacilli bacterium]|nr:tryptophan-rich sensory protein [Bacilli bacterium]
MKINYKKLIIFILGTILIGGIFSMLTMNGSGYKDLIKPINVPGIVFPIVWVILYILMGISIYIISEDDYSDKKRSYTLYIIQLIMNSLWTLFFFGFKWYTFSSIWIVLLLIVVLLMIYNFSKINKTAAFLQIPYVIWLLFALYLNISIAILN